MFVFARLLYIAASFASGSAYGLQDLPIRRQFAQQPSLAEIHVPHDGFVPVDRAVHAARGATRTPTLDGAHLHREAKKEEITKLLKDEYEGLQINFDWAAGEYLPTEAEWQSQSLVAKADEYQLDLRNFHQQVTNLQSEVCLEDHIVMPHTEQSKCWGLGASWLRHHESFSVQTLAGNQTKFGEQAACKWYQEDSSKNCHELFGCWVPSLSVKKEELLNCKLDATIEEPNSDHLPVSTAWFAKKWGSHLHLFAAGHWLFHHGKPGALQEIPFAKPSYPGADDCVAMHIRMGDSCFTRGCASFDDYLRLARQMQMRYNISRIHLATDSPNFPVASWESAGFSIKTNTVDNSKWAVKSAREVIFPELRHGVGNAVAEVFKDIELLSQCKAFIGSFDAGLSKIFFQSILNKLQAIPPFAVTIGCAAGASTVASDYVPCNTGVVQAGHRSLRN